jgi:uncharacterized membrane protein
VRLARRIPVVMAMALIASGLLIIYVHLAWPEPFDRFLEPFLPWRVEVAVKLATAILTIGVVILLVASTGGSKEQK